MFGETRHEGAMPASRFEMLNALFKPWWVRAGAVIAFCLTAIGTYDAVGDQFDLPKLPKVWEMSLGLTPWWGWLLVLQAILVAALFEYVRKTVGGPPLPQQAPDRGGNDLHSRQITELQARVVAADSGLADLSKSVANTHQFALGIMDTIDVVVANALIPYSHLEQKVELIRVDVVTAARDIVNLNSLQRDNRDRALASFAALRSRERLSALKTAILADSAELYERLASGEIYDQHKWAQWENVHTHWWSKLQEWLETGRWYAGDVIKDTMSIDDMKYSVDWTVSDHQFPNSEAVRRFKKFRIIYTQWEAKVPSVEEGMANVAFIGVSELEARNGRAAN